MKKEHFEVILEDLHSKIDGVVEVVLATREDIGVLKTDMAEVKSDIQIIKGVIHEHSADMIELKAKSHVH